MSGQRLSSLAPGLQVPSALQKPGRHCWDRQELWFLAPGLQVPSALQNPARQPWSLQRAWSLGPARQVPFFRQTPVRQPSAGQSLSVVHVVGQWLDLMGICTATQTIALCAWQLAPRLGENLILTAQSMFAICHTAPRRLQHCLRLAMTTEQRGSGAYHLLDQPHRALHLVGRHRRRCMPCAQCRRGALCTGRSDSPAACEQDRL